MAGAGTDFFEGKRNQYQQDVERGQQAAPKVAAANQALEMLSKPTLTSAEAEVLISLYQQAQ